MSAPASSTAPEPVPPPLPSVTVNITRLDLFRLGIRATLRLWWFTAFCFLTFLFSQWSLWTRASPPSSDPISIAVFVLVPAACLLGLWLFFVLLCAVLTAWQAGSMPGTLGTHFYEIRESGLFESTVANETLARWRFVRHATRTRRCIYIKLSWAYHHVIPLRAFPDPESAHAFFCELQLRIAGGQQQH